MYVVNDGVWLGIRGKQFSDFSICSRLFRVDHIQQERMTGQLDQVYPMSINSL